MKSAFRFIKSFSFYSLVLFSSVVAASGVPYRENVTSHKSVESLQSGAHEAASVRGQGRLTELEVLGERRIPQRWIDLNSPAVKELERLGVRVAQDHLINVDGLRFDRLVWKSELHRRLSIDLQDPDKANKIDDYFYDQIVPEIEDQEGATAKFEQWLLSHAIFLGSSIHKAFDIYQAHDLANDIKIDSDILEAFFDSLVESWEGSSWPEDSQAEESRRVMFLTTSGGGGHYTVSTAMSKELKRTNDYHVHSLDYAELQFRCDPMWLATKLYTGDKIYSEIFQQQDDLEKTTLYWDIYGILEEYVPSACNRLLKEEVKEEKPHLLISTMPHWGLHTDVAYSLDLPLRYTSTDYQIPSNIFHNIYHTVQRVVAGAKKFVEFWLPTGDVEMLTGLAYEEVDTKEADDFREVVRKSVFGNVSPEEVYAHPKNPFYVLGYPVRHSFVPQSLTEDEMTDLRVEMDIPEQSRVLILSMGRQGVGILSEIVDRIRQEAENFEQLTHVVVVCGKNAKIADEIRQLLIEYGDHDKVTFDIKGYLSEQDMAKIFTIAEGLISKPGGATAAEASAMKLPLLICHSHPWEEANKQYLKRKKLAFDFNLYAALVPQINVFLQKKMKEKAEVEVVPWATRLREALEEFFAGESLKA